MTVAVVVTAVGSAMNRRRRKLGRFLTDPGAVRIVRDMTELLTSFCGRLRGRRGARTGALGARGWVQSPAAGNAGG